MAPQAINKNTTCFLWTRSTQR